MKCAEPIVEAPKIERSESAIQMPSGLLGFEQVKHYVLLGSQEEAPFLWLQMAVDPSLAFLVISPSEVLDSYQPDISREELDFLGLQNSEDALLFNIVTLHRDGTATVNLKGPIVINRHTLVGKQVVPLNAGQFSLQHPLTVVAAS